MLRPGGGWVRAKHRAAFASTNDPTVRRRRPVGEPAPLPRDLSGIAPFWIVVVLLLAVGYVAGRETGLLGRVQRSVDATVAEMFATSSADTARRIGRTIDGVLPWELLIVLRWLVAVALIAFRRWRHLAVFVGSVVVVTLMVRWFPTAGIVGTGVTDRPSGAMAGTAVTMLGIVYGLAPAGRFRRLALAVTVFVLLILAAVLLVTDKNTFTEIVVGLSLGIATPFLGYRVLVPESVFPVVLRPGRTAHLELTGSRTEAISRALADQLGFEVTLVEPFGLAGSGGSTPMRITLQDGTRLFGKLYATNHLRADRWYKLGRATRYGALEDERSFNSVRRMVEYEDYMLRYLRDQGVPTAEPISFVELTPEREYLLLCGFVEDATEITRARLDEHTIRSGIALVRAMWNAGLAHRDIKPANLLVRQSQLIAIDVFFCQVRPSPWRQSVDLANMMLTLGLGSDAPTVYRLALEHFDPEEIAEAFAASRSVTIPTQLRKMVSDDGRDLPNAFRSLAPRRATIPIQRWTARRIFLATALLGGAGLAIGVTVVNLRSAGF
jgi:tRNA A-37 threonylcarbamoyl transferase component Bud32